MQGRRSYVSVNCYVCSIYLLVKRFLYKIGLITIYIPLSRETIIIYTKTFSSVQTSKFKHLKYSLDDNGGLL